VIARRLRAFGRVQGVGFRDAMVDAAILAGVDGWVRNRRDGSVEAWVQGGEEEVARAVDWARRGPRLALVDRLDVEEVEVDATVRRFARAATA